jgi:hypothetical protein
MSNLAINNVRYRLNRFKVNVGLTPEAFRSRYEQAVAPLPLDEVMPWLNGGRHGKRCST